MPPISVRMTVIHGTPRKDVAVDLPILLRRSLLLACPDLESEQPLNSKALRALDEQLN